MRKSITAMCLTILFLTLSFTACRSTADRKIADRNVACALPESPGYMKPEDWIVVEKKYYNRMEVTQDWMEFARAEAKCIRASECAMMWLAYDGNCGWQAADRAFTNPLRTLFGITYSCDLQKPSCSKP